MSLLCFRPTHIFSVDHQYHSLIPWLSFGAGLGALNLDDLRGVDEDDLSELGLRKLEKRRFVKAIGELDGIEQKLLRAPVLVSPLAQSPAGGLPHMAAATAAAPALVPAAPVNPAAALAAAVPAPAMAQSASSPGGWRGGHTPTTQHHETQARDLCATPTSASPSPVGKFGLPRGVPGTPTGRE